MKNSALKITRIGLLLLTWLGWWWGLTQPLSKTANLILIAVCTLIIYPVVWIARAALDKVPTQSRSEWTTTFVHYGVGGFLGLAIIRAVTTYQEWAGWVIPVPKWIGLVLVIVTGAATLFSVINLALKGFGAPFVIALSKKVATDWMYAWTRNPMMFAGLAFLFSLGIWFQSAFFIIWVLVLCSPALLVFLKVYEERELEIRFGESYLEYKAKTPMLFPRKPKKEK